tara:strand:- start:451 stop:651 length:201 start_codon:yes stop_codon:yes gene_type:complete
VPINDLNLSDAPIISILATPASKSLSFLNAFIYKTSLFAYIVLAVPSSLISLLSLISDIIIPSNLP